MSITRRSILGSALAAAVAPVEALEALAPAGSISDVCIETRPLYDYEACVSMPALCYGIDGGAPGESWTTVVISDRDKVFLESCRWTALSDITSHGWEPGASHCWELSA